jgi:hypothetical protein
VLSLAVPLPPRGERIAKSRSHSDWRAGTAMDSCCTGCHDIPVRDADALGHLDGQMHPFGELQPSRNTVNIT